MSLTTSLWWLSLATLGVRAAQDTTTSTSSSSTPTAVPYTPTFSYTQTFSTITDYTPTSVTGSQYIYLSPTGQRTVSSSSTLHSNGTTNSTSTSRNSQITVSTTSISLTEIGALTTSTSPGVSGSTATSSTSAALPSNTAACNGYPELCNRKYSNITNVCSHNSAFVAKNNAASNQELPIVDQLNDGVRMLQGETHLVNNTVYNCHTSCDLLNVGTWQSELEIVADWLRDNPYEVLTFLIVNSDFITVENYTAPIANAGLLEYVYYPEYVPQYRSQWPTLGDMILKNQRLVFFMDYNANQTAVPYILDQYTHVWETPFSPTDPAFPCTPDRPPNLNQTDARDNLMYLANHNLNIAIDISTILGGAPNNDTTILIPNTAELNRTNAQGDSYGELGATAGNCTNMWGHPPNFLVVDYYNIGSPEPGSVFHVAAAANGVTYNRKCCGLSTSAAPVVRTSLGALAVALAFAVLLSW